MKNLADIYEPDIVVSKGKPVSIILPIKVHLELIERAEDLEDIAWLVRRRNKPMKFRPLEDYLADRQSN